MRKLLLAAALLVAALPFGAPEATAGMILTPQGAAAGFTLSTFATGFPDFPAGNGNGGPFGIAFPSNGTVLVSDLNGAIYVFPSQANNQTVSGATVGATYGSFDNLGMTQAGGKIFLGFQTSNQITQVSSTGTFVSTLVNSFLAPHGFAVNPLTGHLVVASDTGSLNTGSGIWDIDPNTGAMKNITPGVSYDGVTTDGVTVYAAREDDHVIGIRISDGAQVFDSGLIPGADGVSLGTGTLAGDLFVNTNFGQLIEIDLGTGAQTLIGTGGSRGDFVAVDPIDGSLFLDQSDSILRLTPPAGGGFGGGPAPTLPAVPEPSTLALLALGGALAGWRRWKRRATA